MKKWLSLCSATLLLGGSPALAADFSFTGTLPGPNDEQFFSFVVGAPSMVTLRTWSYAGGTNAAGQSIARGGFDPILALFDSTGTLLGQNDDGGSNVAPDAVTGARFDTYFTINLLPGTYTTSVMAYSNFALGPNLANGFSGGGSFTDVTGDQRTNQWAFDILNVQGAIQAAIPEPATWALLLIGFMTIGGAMRSAKKRTRVAVTYG